MKKTRLVLSLVIVIALFITGCYQSSSKISVTQVVITQVVVVQVAVTQINEIQEPLGINSSTATLTITAAAEPDKIVVVLVTVANVRSGPGTFYPTIMKCKKDQTLRVIGRSKDSKWLNIMNEDNLIGWIKADLVQATFDINNLPVVNAPPTPTIISLPTTGNENDASEGEPDQIASTETPKPPDPIIDPTVTVGPTSTVPQPDYPPYP